MPQFTAGESKTAIITMANPKGVAFDYTGYLYIGDTFVAEASFHLEAGEQKQVSFPVTVPDLEGSFPVLLYVYSGEQGVGIYQATEDVTIVGAAAAIEIANISLTPTVLTTARHEYNTSMGIGHWGDPFTIEITFSNPLGQDVWVKPDFAFGHLTGEALAIVETGQVQGFNPASLIYFRLLLSSAAIQGDYSYVVDWQKPWDAKGQNVSSGLAFVYDPDGVPRMGDERWLKVPAGGSITTVKDAHLGEGTKAYKCKQCGAIVGSGDIINHYVEEHPEIELPSTWWPGTVYAYYDEVYVLDGAPGIFDLCVVAWRALYFAYDPGCGQTTVGGKIVTLNWRLVDLLPVVSSVSNMIEITQA